MDFLVDHRPRPAVLLAREVAPPGAGLGALLLVLACGHRAAGWGADQGPPATAVCNLCCNCPACRRRYHDHFRRQARVDELGRQWEARRTRA